MRFSQTGLPLLAALVLSACASKGGDSNTASVNLEVLHGPTFIEGGNATGEQDITVRTPYFAFAISADNGALVDLALAGDGRYGADLVRSLDFVPGEQALRLSELQVVEQSDQRVVIELRREWQGRPLTSRYEVNRDTAGIRLSTTLPSAESVFAGYRLERNEGVAARPDYNDMPNMVQAHWTAASLQNELGILYESDDLRKNRKGSKVSAWLSAGSLGALSADKQLYAGLGRAELALLELAPASSGFEARLQDLRRRWSRGEKVYLGGDSGKLYAYTPNGRLTADYASAAGKGHSFLSFGPQVYPITTNFGGTAQPFTESQVEFRSEVGLARAEVWLDGKQVAGWKINGAKWFRTGVPVPPNHTWMQWVVEDRNGKRAYSNPIWIK
ncbi:hypothetical protein [Oceanimonas doudoroffii]|uniref:Uncharacterized protein n=1 Tax=Oceanimonas doudoroffii TaxID=84158 RepID=A0A233RJA9_9GAMM|nr:hypothetical protein [Oceanimonas doudoroffii]OXY83474.1 hypothetical protein B6S08_08310 [Oceanimonas doudoroffii]